MRPTVTYLWGPMGAGKTTLAQRFAAEKGNLTTAVVDRIDESIEELCKRHQVDYLYVTSLIPPRDEERILIATTIRLPSARPHDARGATEIRP